MDSLLEQQEKAADEVALKWTADKCVASCEDGCLFVVKINT